MKKIGITFASILFAFSTLIPAASAQTTVDQLMATLKTLQAQLDTLRLAQQSVQGTVQTLRNLRLGMSGDDVKALQKLLASDPSVYPEGLVSGYYGALTAKAVRNFQRKHGLEQAGEVGPKTRDILQKLGLNWSTITGTSTGTSTGGVVWGDNDDDKGQAGERQIVICQVPPGNPANRHTISVGISAVSAHLRKGSFIGACDGGGTGTTTPPTDITAPVISAVTVTGTTSSSSTIAWLTNEAASTMVRYSTSTPVVSGSASVSVPGFVTNHSVSLSGLNSGTTYFLLISSADASGNTATTTASFLTQ